MAEIIIGVIVGSLRRESYCRQVARYVAAQMPPDFKMRLLELGDLPIFNQDFDDDGTTPEAWKIFRAQVAELDGFLFVTPEYNRSLPAVLKNALDVASRPYGQNLWGGKPGAIISASPGRPGAFGANHHLRQCMTFLNVYMMQQPECYLGGVDALLAEDGEVKGEGARRILGTFAEAFADWVNRFTG